MIGVSLGAFLAVFGALFVFGIGYNTLVAWLEHKGYIEGYLSLIVALGVAVTLGGVAILSIQAALIALFCFAASGTPMIIGSIWRYLQKREAEKYAMIAEAKDDQAA